MREIYRGKGELEAADEEVLLFLMGFAMMVRLNQPNILLLHAGAVLVDKELTGDQEEE